jgi:hypothetical protein
MFSLNVTLDDDPIRVADWLTTFHHHFEPARPSQSPDAEVAVVAHAEDGPELESELERFRQNWPRYRDRFDQVHKGLLALGYRPVLPQKRKPTSVRGYIAYHLPNGERMFENNSSTAYITGTERYERLRGTHEWIRDSGQLLSVQFTTPEKAEFILDLARAELERE